MISLLIAHSGLVSENPIGWSYVALDLIGADHKWSLNETLENSNTSKLKAVLTISMYFYGYT